MTQIESHGSAMTCDLASGVLLVHHPSGPGPLKFNDQVPVETLHEGIRANNVAGRDLSLYFHLPFCQTLCWFCGCTTVITTQQGQSGTYIGYLQKELDLMGRYLDPKRQVVQLHFGGGTPTFLLPAEIRTLGGMIRDRFRLAADISNDACGGRGDSAEPRDARV